MKVNILGVLFFISVLLVILYTRSYSGFRGGSESIGGRTEGATYSDIDPGMP